MPYLAVILAYPMLIFRTLSEPPETPPRAMELWWREFNINAILLYVPAMILCAVLEWLTHRLEVAGWLALATVPAAFAVWSMLRA